MDGQERVVESSYQRGGPRPSLGRGIAAGVGVALVGGVVWAIVGRITGWQIGYVAIGIGHAVGYSVAKIGRTRETAGAYAAAAISLGAALFGHLAWVYSAAANELHVSSSQVIDAMGPVTVLTNIEVTGLFSWAFFLLAMYAGFRAFASVAEEVAPRVTSGYPPPHATYAPPPAYARPAYAANEYAGYYDPQSFPPVQSYPPPHLGASRG